MSEDSDKKDAHINWLTKQVAHWVDMAAQADVACMQKDAEVKRLTHENAVLDLDYDALVEEISHCRSLITRAADSLTIVQQSQDMGIWMLADIWRNSELLIKELREAAK